MVRRVFETFAGDWALGIETAEAACRPSGATSKSGRPLDKGDVYKLLNNSDLRRRGCAQGAGLSR